MCIEKKNLECSMKQRMCAVKRKNIAVRWVVGISMFLPKFSEGKFKADNPALTVKHDRETHIDADGSAHKLCPKSF